MNKLLGSCFLLVTVLLLGCGPTETPPQNEAEPSQQTSGGHSHDHGDLGPHGGHLVHLSPSNMHAEWTHDDESHSISVFLDDFENITEAKFEAVIGEETEEFPLSASEDGGWSISSEALMTHINMGEAATVSLVVTDDAGQHTTKIEGHDEHHH